MARIRVINIYCSLKIIFLHVDVKERTVLQYGTCDRFPVEWWA